MNRQNSDLPALLGGDPVRPQGPPAWPFEDPDVAHAIQLAMADGSWGRYHGLHCVELTRLLSEYQQREFATLTCSGTAAVELALRGLKVGAGDEVILAAYDFHGNYQNVRVVGATPVLVDVCPQKGNFDPVQLETAVSEKTKAILVSHLHGGLVPMHRVMQFAQEREIGVIEDACQMPEGGLTVAGREIGGRGRIQFWRQQAAHCRARRGIGHGPAGNRTTDQIVHTTRQRVVSTVGTPGGPINSTTGKTRRCQRGARRKRCRFVPKINCAEGANSVSEFRRGFPTWLL